MVERGEAKGRREEDVKRWGVAASQGDRSSFPSVMLFFWIFSWELRWRWVSNRVCHRWFRTKRGDGSDPKKSHYLVVLLLVFLVVGESQKKGCSYEKCSSTLYTKKITASLKSCTSSIAIKKVILDKIESNIENINHE